MKLDFSELKESVMVEEGVNTFIIKGAKVAKSQNGTNMLVLDMTETEAGGFIRDNVCLEGPGAFRAQQLIKALGLSEDDFVAMEAADLIGMNVSAEVVHEEYEGTERARIKKYVA